MQTFLPYKDFVDTAECLDKRRLGKQRSEAKIILNILEGKSKPNKYGKISWINHPAVQMWAGHEDCLKHYLNCIIEEWEKRGYKNNMLKEEVNMLRYPYWLGDERLHKSHKSKLLEKDKEFYGRYGWNVEPGLSYFWPTKACVSKRVMRVRIIEVIK